MKRVLIDACVARSAGDRKATASRAVACCMILGEFTQHSWLYVVMTPALLDECKTHGSKFFIHWLASMASKGRVLKKSDKKVATVRRAVAKLATQHRTAIQKDLHLTEAAIMHGAAVISTDDKQRSHLRMLAALEPRVAKVQWISPEDDGWKLWITGKCGDSEFSRVAPIVTHGPKVNTAGAQS